jgi:hypothetical protein
MFFSENDIFISVTVAEDAVVTVRAFTVQK